MSGGGGSTNTVEKADPWEPSQPYLKEGMEGARQGILYNPGSTVVPFSPESQYGMAMAGNRALQGSPLIGAAQQTAMDTMLGNYMQGPGWDKMTDSVVSAVRPGIDSMFEMGGRTGSNAHAEALGRGVGRGLAPLIDAERNRMMGTMGMAPSLAQADYMDPQMLQQIGAMREGKALQYAQEPYDRLSRYFGLVAPAAGMGGTAVQSGGSGYSPLMGGMGGAASGAALGSMFGPWGTAIGAIGGGLMGAMG